MFSSGKSLLPSLENFFRTLVVAIFLIGLLPVPALAVDNGNIAGQVIDSSSNNTIPGVTIYIFEAGAPQPTVSGSTDGSGNYTLSVPPGTGYEVEAHRTGYVTQRVTGQDVTANSTTFVNFNLAPGGIIQGVVTDNTSTPIQNASVYAYKPETPGTIYTSLSTNGTGNYELTAPLDTGYIVEVLKQGYISANQTGIAAVLGTPTIVNFTLLQPSPPPQDATPPATVNNLAIANAGSNNVTLTWTAPGDDGDNGTAAQYNIHYATSPITDNITFNAADQATNIPLPHAANTTENFIVTGLSANTTYFFALKTADEIPNWSELSNVVSANTTLGGQQPPPPQGQPSFTIGHTSDRSSFMLGTGDNITESFYICSTDNFTGTVFLSLQGPPEIQNNSSVSPSSVNLTASGNITITLILGASAMTPSGTYQCGLWGQTDAYGGQQRGYFITVIIGVAGQPLLSASPAVVAAGSPTNFFASQFPPSANITLQWDSGPKVGQTLVAGQTSGDGTWDVSVTIPADMPGGNFGVKAISGASKAVFQLTITTGAGPDFLISTSPQFISIAPGNSDNITIYVNSVNDFNSPVALSTGAAPGVTCTLSTGNVTPSSGQAGSATLTIAVADWVSPSMYQINVNGSCADPPLDKVTNISLDIQPPAQWGPGISLSQSYAMVGDTITVSGANFPPQCDGQTVTIIEATSNTTLQTNPATITVNNGSFTGTFTIPDGIPSGNYRIKAIVVSTGDFAERDFQILGTGETFTLDVSPSSTAVATEQGNNSATVTVNLFSIGGNSPTVNLALEGVPSWLTYQFGSLPVNTPASSDNAVSVPAGGSTSRNLVLTASLTAPTGSYPITVKGWVTGSPEIRESLQLTVQPPAGFGMAQFNLSPAFGGNGQIVNFSGSGFTGCTPSQVTELKFGGLDILTGQSLPTITVPTTGDAAGRFSGTFRVPSVLAPGTYPVDIRVGSMPNDKFVGKPFTITGGNDTFVLQASPSFLWMEQGGNMTTMIQAQATGSSSATVILSLEGYPSNDILASLSSSNITAPPGGIASTDLTLTAQTWLPAGHYTITVKGQLSGGAEVHRIPLELDVAPPAGSDMASIYLSPTSGSPGTWVTISGNGFPISSNVTHLYLGSPTPENDWVSRLPTIVTDDQGSLTAVIQVSANLTPGMYPIEVVVGEPPADRRACAQFTLVSSDASFNINLSPMMIQAAPGTPVSTSVNVQSFGTSSANITLTVEGPPTIEWRFDGGGWQTPTIVSPSIGSTLVSSLEIQPKASTPMGHYSLAVKATAGAQTEIRNLELDVGASAGYNMPIFSLNPNTGMAGTNVAFSGTNFPPSTPIAGITFGSANITLSQAITTSAQGSFSGAFTVPATIGGQPIAPGSYPVRVFWGQGQAEAQFGVYGSNDTFVITLSPNFLQGGPGTEARTSGLLKALGGASPAVKMALKGLPPGVETNWNGLVQPVFNLSAPPGGQNNFELGLVLPGMIAMGQYPAVLEGWVDTNSNNAWDTDEKIVRVNLQLSVMPAEGYGMGILSLTPSYGHVGDTITFAGSGFPADTAVQSLTFAQTDVLTANITTSADGSFSGVFIVPSIAFGASTGPGRYPVDVIVGTPPDDRRGGMDFQVVSANQKFSVDVSPGWLARPAGDIGSVNVVVRSLVTTPPSPNVILRVEGLPMGVTPSFTTANVTPPVGGTEGRELQLTISSGAPMGNYPVSIRAYNAAAPQEEIWVDFTLEITPSSGFMDMGMATVTMSPNFGSVGDRITVSGYGFPKSQNLTFIRLGPTDVTPTSVNTTTDATGAFSAVVTVPSLPSGPHPLEVNVQNTIRSVPFNIMGVGDTFSLKVSPSWLEPIPAGDPNGRQLAITVNALPGKTPAVTLSTEGLFAAYGTITQTWDPATCTVNVTSAGGAATATLTLIPSANLPPGPYPFNIVAVDGSNRRDYHMEFQVGPPSGFMDMTQQGVFFPDIFLSPRSGPAGTQVTYTGTNLPAGANVTSINFAGHAVPLPASGLVADSSGGFSGTLIVDESWNLPPGGMYWVNFRMEKDTWWQDIGKDFNLMRSDAAFTLEANPNWIPPIPQGATGQTKINVKAMGYNTTNITLAVMESFGGMGIPGGATPHWNTGDGPATTNATAPGGSQTSKDFYLEGSAPGHFMITIVGWIDSNGNQIMDPSIPSEAESAFLIPLDFDVEPPQGFKTWDMNDMMTSMNMTSDDKYLLYFPEIIIVPSMGPADTKVNINATDFPAGANVTHLRFAGTELPVPATAADDNGNFNLVFNVPRTVWGGNIGPGWYDIEVEAQKTGEPSIFIRKPFQVTSSDVAFTIWAEPNFLPPIPPNGNGSTLIRIKSIGSAANVTLSVDKIPAGVSTSFSSSTVNVTAGGSGSSTLTLTPNTILPGHYFAEIKGTATVSGSQKEFYAHLEFDVQPPEGFNTWDRDDMITSMNMTADDMYLLYFPEIVLNPNMGPAGNKVTITATDYPAGANVTHLRFAGMELPVPTNTAADSNGDFTLVFNVPRTIWNADIGSGWYDVEVEAQKPGEPQVFIRKPFQVTASDVAFTMSAEPSFLPTIPFAGSSSTLIRVKSTSSAANITLSVDKIPPGVGTSFSSSTVNVTAGGSGSISLTLTPTTIPPGHYFAEIKGTASISGSEKIFYTHIEFDVETPEGFTTWNRDDMMTSMNMTSDDIYLLYFPEIVLNPNMGPAGKKVTIVATDYPAGANVTHLRFAGMELPVPTNTAADSNGDFTLVFNVPRTIWNADIGSGWYDVEVEAQKPGEPQVFIRKPFQVTASDVAFTMRAEPDWLPPIPPTGSNTTIRLDSMGSGAVVTLSMDKIPPGINTTFAATQVNVPPGGSGTTTLTLTPSTIPPGHYGAEIKGVATINGTLKTVYAHIEFDVQPSTMFKDTTWMQQQGVWFPEITLNPTAGPVKTKVTISATDFPAGANVTRLRFAGRELPVPTNTAADANGNASLVFNVPSDFGMGQYMVEVEASKAGMPPVFIAKPFFIQDSGVTFKLNVVPGFIPGVPQGSSGNTTVFIESTGQSVTVQLYVDGLPPGVTATFDDSTLTVGPGSLGSTRLTITTRASTGPGQYPLTIRGISGAETRMMSFGFGVMPPANFQMPRFTINPDYAPAGYTDKQYKITFSGTGFPPNRSVSSLKFGSQTVAIPADLVTDANGDFNGVFQMPIGLDPGTYDVRVAVADGSGGYIYDSRPFSIRGADATFILQLSPPYLPPVVQGGNVTITVNPRSVGTTTANITLFVDGLAPGITATFSPSNNVTVSPGSSGSATIVFDVSPNTPPGPYPVSIRGITGNEAAVVPLGFGVMPNIGAGEGHASITINPPQARPGEHIGISGAGFTANATITLTAGPAGASIPINITPGTILVQSDRTWATEITVPPAAQVPPGIYIIKAADGVMAAKNSFSIIPADNADFFLNLSPQFLKVAQGYTGNTTLTLSSQNGFKEAVTFRVGHLAPGVTATFQNTLGNTVGRFMGMPGGTREVIAPTPMTPVPGEALTVTVLIVADTATPIGPYDIPLEAMTSTIARAIPLGLMVVSTGADMIISPSSGPADTDIRLSGSGYTAGETVTITFANNNITTVPATITVAQDGTFTAVITAPAMSAGIYPVKATGVTSGISVDRPFSLKPSAVNTFVLYTSPMKVDVPKGGSGIFTAKVEPLGSFQSTVTLNVTGLSGIAGASANISPAATITPSIGTPTTAMVTINIPAGAAMGKYPLTVTGTSGNIIQTRTITLNVVPPVTTPDFAISLAPNTLPVGPGGSVNTTVKVTAINGFTGTVNLAVAMSSANATWPSSISYTATDITPSANTGMGKQEVVFTASADVTPGTWTFRVTGTSGVLSHSTDVMVVCTPSGTTVTTFASPRLDTTTVTPSTPINMTPPWGDRITIQGIINDGAEANVITPASVNITPNTLANLPSGATDMLGRVTNVESSAPVDGVQWNIGFPYDPAQLTAAGLQEENLKVAYLDPSSGNWTEVTTTVDTTNKIAYASPTHFSSWTLIATPAPPVSQTVTEYYIGGGGGVGGISGFTSLTDYITTDGRFAAAAIAQSADSLVEISIPKDTIGLNKFGQPLYSITIREYSAPAPPPADTSIIGLVYDIGPNGATFVPPVNLTLKYNDSQLPAGVSEANLVIVTWQNETWVELENCSVDPVSNTITAPVSHFTIFTIMAPTAAASFKVTQVDLSKAVISPEERVAIKVTIVNTGDVSGSYDVALKVNGKVSSTEQLDLAGHASKEVSFTLKLDKAGKYTIDVNGTAVTLTVQEAAAEPVEETKPTEVPAAILPEPAETRPPEMAPVPTEIQPVPAEMPPEMAAITPEVPVVPAVSESPKPMNTWLILLVIAAAGAFIIALVYWRTRARA